MSHLELNRSPSRGVYVLPKPRCPLSDQKMDIAVEDIGQQNLKNIAEPVHCHRISFDNNKPQPKPPGRSRAIAYFGLAAGFALVALVVGGWIVLGQAAR